MIKKGFIMIIKALTLILIVLLLTYLFKTAKNFGYHIFDDKAKDVAGTPTVVNAVITVTEDEDLMDLAEDLELKSIIRDKYAFVVCVRFMEKYDQIIPGIYELNSGMKPSEILNELTTATED